MEIRQQQWRSIHVGYIVVKFFLSTAAAPAPAPPEAATPAPEAAAGVPLTFQPLTLSRLNFWT